jgi:uncharacterized protein (TIGR01777 family)
MKIVLFGGSGFLGKHLVPKLLAESHGVTLISRRPEIVRRRIVPFVEVKEWSTPEKLGSLLEGTDAFVNLAGESIGAKRWSVSRKDEILTSRIETTRTIVETIGKMSRKPSVLLSASAVGYYGNVEDEEVTETHLPGKDFLADVCVRWETEAMKAERLGVRVILPRTGIVLAKNGGALQRMLVPFRLFAGGPLGSGNQWFPWIHIDDEINAMIHTLEHSAISGPINLVAPESITMKQFCSAFGKAMHRPSWAPVPSFVLKVILGEMAEALVLGGQKVVSKKLVESGYRFKFSRIDEALVEILH